MYTYYVNERRVKRMKSFRIKNINLLRIQEK